MIKKVLQSIFDQGHSLTSRGQGRIFRVTAYQRHGSACKGGFGRNASEKGGFRGKKACHVDFDPSKLKILSFQNFEFCVLGGDSMHYLEEKIILPSPPKY